MGKRSRAGFNTPFAGIARRTELVSKPESKPTPAVRPPEPQVSDADLFARAVAGAERIPSDRGRVEPSKRETAALPDDEQLALLELESLVQGKGSFRLFESEESHWGIAPGVSYSLLERLQHGHFSFRRHLDLHGLSRDEAKQAVTRFITEARRDGERCLLIITGRGRSSPDGVSVLRETLPRWLSRAPLTAHVLAFSTAEQVHGGPGAYYVLLRRPGVRPFGV